MNTTIMRALRHKHGVSLAELARCAGVSAQYISGIELGAYPATEHMRNISRSAFERLIRSNREHIEALADDLAIYRESLLDPMEDENGL
ncbi:MAG: helix-turn-helix domain-containing protein [Oscillospiraceae bacterium]|jgi:transcriptional regulator with XRE-family HTH domain|nr:helix-turn-helix domain-containing protein [Oscillospiraceae bacterium]